MSAPRPCGSLNAYLADNYWQNFADKYHEDCNGIDDIATDNIKVYSRDGRIVVEGADGETVQVFDMMGREVINSQFSILNFQFPTGIYMVKVGNHPARKVAVIR